LSRSYPVKNIKIELLSENRLSFLVGNKGSFLPAFDEDVTSYTMTVDSDVDNVKLSAFTKELGAEIKINTIETPYGQPSLNIPLDYYDNQCIISVKSESGITKNYVLNITRLPEMNNLISTPLAEFTDTVCFCAWVKLDALAVDSFPVGKSLSFRIEACRTFQSIPILRLYFADATSKTLNGVAAMEVGTWTHLGCIHDGATGISKFFVNGVLVRSVTDATKIGVNLASNTNPIQVGQILGSNAKCNARDAKVYNTLILDSQIKAIYDLRLIYPTITDFTPAGISGDKIHIYGTNFSNIVNTATINGLSSTITYINPLQLDAIVPNDLPAGTGKITVVANGDSVTSTSDFTLVIPPKIPVITKIPYCGVVGSNITITGYNFSDIMSNNIVKLGNLPMTVVSSSNTAIIATIPANAISSKITVEVSNHVGESTNTMLITQSSAAIRTIVDATAAGGTAELPEGVFLITSRFEINKTISLKGAGIDKTVFVMQEGLSATVMQINGNNASYPVIVEGLTIEAAENFGAFSLIGLMSYFRIHHCKFNNAKSKGIRVATLSYGLIDHCTLLNCVTSIQFLQNYNRVSWDDPEGHPIGTEEASFIEDCIITGEGVNICACDGDQGTRFVFRHNYVKTTVNYTAMTAHGRSGKDPAGYRGNFSFECYENTYEALIQQCWYGIFVRSGRGVIFNNTITGNVGLPIAFADYNSFSSGNIDPETGDYYGAVYPSPDQINNFYIWNNTYNGVLITDGHPQLYVPNLGYCRQNIQLNRDYFDSEMPGYTPYIYPHPLNT
jgi:hypothetical protein